MTKLKKKSNLLIITLIFISFFIIPLLGIRLNYSNTYNQIEKDTIKLDSIPSSASQSSLNNLLRESYPESKPSKFEKELDEFLTNLPLNQIENPDYIKIIISFEESIKKAERIEILDSIFDDYEVISNYDLIPGIFIKVNPTQLINYEDVINGIKSIKQIYKSNIYHSPYILDNDLQISALNPGDYSNWWLSAIGAENLVYDGSGVKVAVIDTGIYNHPDLDIVNNSNFVTGESPLNYNDDVGHGTHVGGIIAGDGGGSSGQYIGVAPGALLINARAGNASGLEEGNIISAIQWSAKPTSEGGAGADIISMSFGGGYPEISDSITQVISNAKNDYGVIFVASAGNSGGEYFTGSTPASGIDVIAVGATDENDELTSFSSWGPTFGYLSYPDVVAPGLHIISTEAFDSIISKEQRYKGDYFNFPFDADYIPLSGTSMSCPIVAGALAILLDAYPNMTPETARIALLEGARKLSNENDDDFLKSGAGIINVTASLNYLNYINSTIPNYNDIAILSPNELPVKPYDLLNFPGDHQKFNLTVISGNNNTFYIEIPNDIQGISLSLEKSTLIFSDSGIGFVELEIEIDKEALPGIRMFQINLTDGIQNFDTANIVLEIRLPEYNILMDSYHGLNDWFPPLSFYQMGFYEAMEDLSNLNISIDYKMEHWTPDYNKNTNNSILTEERLAQYDLVFLQTPVLPYSPTEIKNLKNYFEDGGSILFLGTRYQDMVIENINYLFSTLGVDIQINEENIMNDNWLGIGATVSSQVVANFTNSRIFKDVDKFYWSYGNSFTTSSNSESIAFIDNDPVVALFNGTSQRKGNLLAFGDLHWIFSDYKSNSHYQNHSILLENVMEFLLPEEQVSININLGGDRISDSTIDLSVYLKNQTTETPINTSDFTSLKVIISNNSDFSESITLNTTYSDDGIYFNNSYNLPSPSYTPYTIEVNLTIGTKSFNKTTKILYFDKNELPKIIDLYSTDESISRATGQYTNLIAEMDKSTYNIEGYLSIYSYSFYNTKVSVNKTFTFSYSVPNSDYRYNFDPDTTDPSGYVIYYIIPTNSNYSVANSPRYLFEIINNPPQILTTSSTFNFGGYADIYFDETESAEGSYVYSTTRGDTFNFAIDVRDTVLYEDDNSDMRLFVNLFICSVTNDGFVIFIFPETIEVAELNFITSRFEGSFTIPNTMEYSTISGTKSISTIANFDAYTNQGYLALLYFTVYDSEGEYDDFVILLTISDPPMDYSLIIIIVISIIALLGVVSAFVYYSRRKRHPRTSPYQQRVLEYYIPPSYEEPEETRYITPRPLSELGQFYCPFCGEFIRIPKKFCPHCGESLEFNQQED
ncbi:MAG: S8 family serine peptidase [Promethearchaeota archaeon]